MGWDMLLVSQDAVEESSVPIRPTAPSATKSEPEEGEVLLVAYQTVKSCLDSGRSEGPGCSCRGCCENVDDDDKC